METIQKFKVLFKQYGYLKYGTLASAENKKAIGDAIRDFNIINMYYFKGNKGEMSNQYLRWGIRSIFVFCYNKKNGILIFPSINSAKHYFKISWPTLKKNLDNNKYINIHGEEWLLQSIPRSLKK